MNQKLNQRGKLDILELNENTVFGNFWNADKIVFAGKYYRSLY